MVPVPAAPEVSGLPLARATRLRCTQRRRESVRRGCRAAATVLGRDLAVVVDGSTTPAGADDLLVLDPGADGATLTQRQRTRVRTAAGPVLVLRLPPLAGGALLVLDDGTPAALPALCAGLEIAASRPWHTMIAGPAGTGAEARAVARDTFGRLGVDVETIDVRTFGEDGYKRVVRARSVSLLVVSDTARRGGVGGELAATAPCSVLYVR